MMHFQSSSRQRELIALARRLARERFAPRADRHDRAASFPFDDYADLRTEGLLGLCVPERYGGLGADYEPRYLSTERWQWRRNRSNGCGEMASNPRSRVRERFSRLPRLSSPSRRVARGTAASNLYSATTEYG
jgi:hypothetical protein